MSEFKPTEVAFSYDLGAISPFKNGFRVVITQVLDGKRQNDVIGGPGYYYSNTYILPNSFGTWKIIERLYSHAHKTLEDAVAKIPEKIESIKKDGIK